MLMMTEKFFWSISSEYDMLIILSRLRELSSDSNEVNVGSKITLINEV